MDNAESSSSLDTFTCFPRLPPELRLRVWDYAVKAPRIVKYTIIPAYVECGDSSKYLWFKKWHGTSEMEHFGSPDVLQTNRESRSEAQKVLEWKSSSEGPSSAAVAYHNLHVPKFFRNDVDIVYIQSAESLSFDSLILILHGFIKLGSIKNLALSLDLWNVVRKTLVQRNGEAKSDIIRSSFVRIAQFKNLIIVIQDKNFNWRKLNDNKDSYYGYDRYLHDEEKIVVQEDGWIRTDKEADEDEYEDEDEEEDEVEDEDMEEDEKSIPITEFHEVLHNTEYAQFLKAQFEGLKDVVVKDEVFKREATNKTMVTMEMTVLSE